VIVRVAQVKCLNCGRVCGEISAPSVRELTLEPMEKVYVPTYATGFGLSGASRRRCRRCGGMVYVDEPFTSGPAEVLASQKPLSAARDGGEAQDLHRPLMLTE